MAVETRLAAISENMSLRRHLEEYVKPWLSANAKAMEKKLEIRGAYERIEDKEALSELHKTVEEGLTGEWCAIVTPWELRRDRMLSALVESQPFTFRPRIQLDPAGTASLSQALNARLYEKARTESEKRNYHVINAFSLALSRLEYWKAAAKTSKPKPPAPGWMSA